MGDGCYATRALNNAEIITRILSCLPTTAKARCARVNRQWFAVATNFLWQLCYLDGLARVEPERRQIYASMMYEVELSTDSLLYKNAQGLRFEKLESVSFTKYISSEDAGGKSCLPFRASPVTTLHFFDSAVDDEFLDRLPKMWPNIEVLFFGDNQSDKITPGGFFRLVSSCPALTELDVSNDMYNIQSDDLFPHCAVQTGLYTLKIPGEITLEAVQRAKGQGTDLFPSLRVFGAYISSEGFSLLIDSMSNLTTLELGLADVKLPILSRVSTFLALKVLVVWFPRNYDIPKAEILCLRALVKLEQLIIGVGGDEGSVYEVENDKELDFVDVDFEQVFRELKHLDTLTFKFDCTLTAKAMICLADNCRGLFDCTLPSDIDLKGLNLDARADAAFPRLSRLHLESLYTSKDAACEPEYVVLQVAVPEWLLPFCPLTLSSCRSEDGKNFAAQMEKHFPKLATLNITDRSRGFEHVAPVFKSLFKDNKQRLRRELEIEYGLGPDDWTKQSDESDEDMGDENSDDDEYLGGFGHHSDSDPDWVVGANPAYTGYEDVMLDDDEMSHEDVMLDEDEMSHDDATLDE